jgi:HNH endonuclease
VKLSIASPISVAYLRELFDLHEDGRLFWRARPREHFSTKQGWSIWNPQHAGKEAGYRDSKGYVRIRIDNRLVQSHHIVFAMTTGAWPVKTVDHRDGIPSNNAVSNPREATQGQQQQNRKLNKTIRPASKASAVSAARANGTRESVVSDGRIALASTIQRKPHTSPISPPSKACIPFNPCHGCDVLGGG